MTDDAMEDEKPMEDPPPITEQCVATARSTGNRCQNSAIDGGNVCRFHGGATEHVQEAADERLERLARELLANALWIGAGQLHDRHRQHPPLEGECHAVPVHIETHCRTPRRVMIGV